MSQTVMETDKIKEFEQTALAAHKKRHDSGLRSGPVYVDDGENAPQVWFGQAFERDITPSGTVDCTTPLRVGSTNNGLDIVLVASHANSGNISIPKDATITVTLLQADDPAGPFEEVGPTICVKAPANGISVEPDLMAARFPIGNFQKSWLKCRLEFTGAITGGALDCVLHYMPR